MNAICELNTDRRNPHPNLLPDYREKGQEDACTTVIESMIMTD